MKRQLRAFGAALIFAVLCVSFLSAAGIAYAGTFTIADDFSADSGLWSYVGSAYRDAGAGNVVLTQNNNAQVGVLWLRDREIRDRKFTVEFSYLAGGGTGADGIVLMFYKNKNYSPGGGGVIGFIGGDLIPVAGYGVEFDNHYNYEHYGMDPSGRHIAVIKDRANNHLKYVNTDVVEDNRWHQARVVVDNRNITVFVDGNKMLEYVSPGDLDRTFGGLGFSGATGAFNHWHRIDNVRITLADEVAPSTNIDLEGITGNNGWFRSDVVATLNAEDGDGSGVSRTEYSFDGTNWITYTGPFTIAVEGLTTVYYRSIDKAGNVEATKSAVVLIDKTPPEITGAPTTAPNGNGWYNTGVVIHFEASDDVSGIASVTPDVLLTTEGEGLEVTGTAADRAGNTASCTVGGINIDLTAPSAAANPPGGTYSGAQSIALATSEPATFYYTTDGSEPGEESPVYEGPLEIAADTVFKFFAVDRAGNRSQIYTESYTILPLLNLKWYIYGCKQLDTGLDWTCDSDFGGITQTAADLASTTIVREDGDGDGMYDRAEITVQGGYPGYYNKIVLDVKNTGTEPIPLEQVKIANGNPEELELRLLESPASSIAPGRRKAIGIALRVKDGAAPGLFTFTVSL